MASAIFPSFIGKFKYTSLMGLCSFNFRRQGLIDKFNGDADIFVFLLSTKAGQFNIKNKVVKTI